MDPTRKHLAHMKQDIDRYLSGYLPGGEQQLLRRLRESLGALEEHQEWAPCLSEDQHSHPLSVPGVFSDDTTYLSSMPEVASSIKEAMAAPSEEFLEETDW